MENTRLFKIIIIIVWRTQDIKVFSSTNTEGSGGGGWKFGFDYYEPYQGRVQDSRSLVLCSALKRAILESNFPAFYLVPSREEVRGVGEGYRGPGLDSRLFPTALQPTALKMPAASPLWKKLCFTLKGETGTHNLTNRVL